MNVSCTDRFQNFHRWRCNTCHISPRSVVSHKILHQNAGVYIKIHTNLPLVLRISTGGGATLVTLLREVLKVIFGFWRFRVFFFEPV